MKPSPTLLSIAGSDPSGGAGIQADLKTFTAIGIYGAAAVTCLTVQNSRGVQEFLALPADFVKKQIKAVLADHRVTHIKIGMIGNPEIATSIGEILQSFSGVSFYDPVTTATSGEDLFVSDGTPPPGKSLLNHVTILTPNRFELELLAGQRAATLKESIKLGWSVLRTFPQMAGIVIKGDHFHEDEPHITDCLLLQDKTILRETRKRYPNYHLHGTGCTFCSAFAGLHCLSGDYAQAFTQASQFMDQIIRASMGYTLVKSGANGPLLHHLMNR